MSDREMSELQILRAQRRLLRDERLALKAHLAQAFADFTSDGKQTPAAVRASKKARLARVELELARLDSAIYGIEVARQRLRAKSMLAHLTEVLREEALDHLVLVAKSRVDAEEQSLEAQAIHENQLENAAVERLLRDELERRLAEPLEA